MGEPEPEKNGDIEQSPPRSLGTTIFGLILCSGLLLLALGLTEAIHRVLGPLGATFYYLATTVLMFAVLGGSLLAWKRLGLPMDYEGPEIWTPRVMRHGFLRVYSFLESDEHPFRNSVVFIFIVVMLGSLKAVLKLWEALGFEARSEFEDMLVFLVSVFGTFLCLLLIASLAAGLWPERRKGDHPSGS